MQPQQPYSYEYCRFDSQHEDSRDTYFVMPTERALSIHPRAHIEPSQVMVVDHELAETTIFPIDLSPLSSRFFLPKYDQLHAFHLSHDVCRLSDSSDLIELAERLPPGFVHQPEYGFGLQRKYKPIVESIEAYTSCVRLRLSLTAPEEAAAADTFEMGSAQFDALRAELHRIDARAGVASRRVRRWYANNFVAPLVGQDVTELKRGRHPIVKLLTDEAADVPPPLSEHDIRHVGQALRDSVDATTRIEPLAQLKRDVDLVNLEALITKFSEMLSSSYSEASWQEFFELNPFILHLTFGFPVVQVQAQASVGGRRLDGGGEKYADFLAKHVQTNNLGLFEIKTPEAPIVAKAPYRDGVYAPSTAVASAMNQILDQRYKLAKHLSIMKDNARDSTLESYSIRCCLIIGSLQDLNPDQEKSFELFRGNSASVEVTTFDELLARLSHLRDAVGDAT